MKHTLAASLAAGLLFGLGLMVSGMADPARVLGFLTIAPGWDPTLAFVMGGALAVTLPGFAWLRRRERPWLAGAFAAPAPQRIDGALLAGAALFGLGWGLGGYCPGPGIVGAALANPSALIFVVCMLAGGWLSGRRP